MAIPREGRKYKKEILEKQLATMTQKEVAKLYNTTQQYIAVKAKQFGIDTDYSRITNSVGFTQDMKDLVFGSLLGDLHAQKNRRCKQICLYKSRTRNEAKRLFIF